MQMCNIRCFNARPRLDWSSVAMATEPSNQQNALMPNDLQYNNTILSTVRGGGMKATARSPSPIEEKGPLLLSHLEVSGLFATVTNRCETQPRPLLK
jgi:hypothetical protein